MDLLFNDLFYKVFVRPQKRTPVEDTTDHVKYQPPVQVLRAMMNDIFHKFFDRQQIKTTAGQKPDHAVARPPVQALTQHVGEDIEVHYMDAGLSQIIDAHLTSSPNEKSFYLSLNDMDTNIVYWYDKDSNGLVSGVKLIKARGEILYTNDTLPFDYDKAEHHGHGYISPGPIRKKTREYLSGKFG